MEGAASAAPFAMKFEYLGTPGIWYGVTVVRGPVELPEWLWNKAKSQPHLFREINPRKRNVRVKK